MQKQKIKIGLQIARQMKKLKLKKFHVAAFAEISRTQLDKILHADNDYTFDTLLKVLETVSMDINLVSTFEPVKPEKRHKKSSKQKTITIIDDNGKSKNIVHNWP